MYIGEISAAKFRGIFGFFVQLGLATGVLLNYAIGSIPGFPYYNNALVAAGITAGFEVFMVTLYESPRWLVAQGHIEKAYHSLRWLRGPCADIDAELQSSIVPQTAARSVMNEFSKRSVVVPVILVVLVMFFKQIGGVNAISSFAVTIFTQAGVNNPRATATYAYGGVTLVTTLAAVFFIDLIGRKILLIISSIGMVAGALLLGVDFYLTRPSLCSSNSTDSSLFLSQSSDTAVCNGQYGPLAIASVIIFGASFSIGWGPIPWILVSELTPLHVRGVASGVATFVNWGNAALVVGVYTSYAEAVTVWFAWWTFAFFNTAAVVFTVFFLRETKGNSLEDIENYYQRHVL